MPKSNETEIRSLKKITADLDSTVEQIENLIEEFSQLRFELLDRSEQKKDKKAQALYYNWTREMHLDLANAMEKKPD